MTHRSTAGPATRTRTRRIRSALALMALAIMPLVTTACAHTKKNDDQPVIHLDKTWHVSEPTTCDLEQKDIVVRQGRVPANADKIVDIDLRADRPTPLALFESILAQWALRHCVPTVALLRAELADGASGVTRVVAVGYRASASIVTAPR